MWKDGKDILHGIEAKLHNYLKASARQVLLNV
jgi:hypothetical protein